VYLVDYVTPGSDRRGVEKGRKEFGVVFVQFWLQGFFRSLYVCSIVYFCFLCMHMWCVYFLCDPSVFVYLGLL
jgi:hypothetical protein